VQPKQRQEDRMEHNNINTKTKKYSHLKESERFKIEVLLEQKKSPIEIAQILTRGRATIYREIKRGSVMRTQYDLTEARQYRACFAQRDYQLKGKNKQGELKIGKDTALEDYIRKKLISGRFSPDAIIGEIKQQRLKFKGIISTKTLYRYIDAGVFSGISNENLWEKRKRKKHKYKTIKRISYNNRMGRSIEQRPIEVDQRLEYGHWEGDCVKGPQGKSTGLFTLTERKSLEQIIIKIYSCTQAEIQRSIDDLEKKLGADFYLKFKTITFDNGVEFLNWKSLEMSFFNNQRTRTRIYFAHAYSAWERGSNEVQNKMIRRFIPKGTDICLFSEEEIQKIQDWMNNYPRKKLGYKTANMVAKENLLINRIKSVSL